MYRVRSLVVLALILAVILVPVAMRPAHAAAPQAQAEAPGFRVISPLSADTPVVGVVLIPLRNLPLLFYYAYATNEPGSPLYHHYLTQQQEAQLFYPTQKFEEVVNYLRSHGLTIYFTGADSAIVFGGTAGQVERALGVTIYLLGNGTDYFYESFGQPSIQGVYVYVSNVTALILRRPPDLITQQQVKQLAQAVSKALGGRQQVLGPIVAYPMTELAPVYNATALYEKGINGSGINIGIIDFYGNPTVKQDLWYYDQLFGLPNPPLFEVVPLGPYDPELGLYTGWAFEEDLDVEASHSMAPGAGIVVYTPNGALSLAPVIAYIDQQDMVSVVSQSFSIPDTYMGLLGPQGFVANIYYSDLYYALGAAEGITFLASSGDGGGMGYSGTPLGTVGYPADSPFVTAMGGTTTYIDQLPNGTEVYEQTAWSAAGFVPFFYNFGGSTGGYSAVEPMPWYQRGVAPSPNLSAGFTYGRANPDLSANANIFPGVYVVTTGNLTYVSGGTSEASPLTAGLLALVEQYVGHRLGLLNPTLYELYRLGLTKAFENITFGYNIPWVVKPGYNLVTGLGALNAGMLAYYLKQVVPRLTFNMLAIQVYLKANGQQAEFGEVLPGQLVNVSASVEYPNGTPVSTGSFYTSVYTIQGLIASAPLKYNTTTGLWTAVFTMPSNASGITFVYVSGSSQSYSGLGLAETYTGYYAFILSPFVEEAVAAPLGVPIKANITLLNGTPVPNGMVVTLRSYVYNMLSNTFTPIPYLSVSGPTKLGMFSTLVMGPYDYDYGDAYIMAAPPAYGFTTFYNGVGLQNFIITPEVITMPAGVSPGSPIVIVGTIVPPLNPQQIISYALGTPLDMAIAVGSNVTAVLVAPNGTPVAVAQVHDMAYGIYKGLLEVPPNAQPGLYKVYLVSNYSSFTLESIYGQPTWVSGNIIGELYVEPSPSVSIYFSPPLPHQNEQVTLTAEITYPNGTPVKFGVFGAQTSFGFVPLSFNGTAWVGSFVTPVTFTSASYAFVLSGISSTAMPAEAVASLLTDKYVLYEDTYITAGQFLPYDDVFYNVTLSYSGVISDSYFEGFVNVTDSNLTIVDSTIDGVLKVTDSNVTIAYSSGLNIVAVNSTVRLLESSISSVQALSGSKVITVLPSSTQQYIEGIEHQLESELATVESYLSSNVSLLSSKIAEVSDTLNSYIAGNVSKLMNEISSTRSQLSLYIANNYTALSSQLASTRSALSSSILGNVSALEEKVAAVRQALSSYIVGNYTALSKAIASTSSTLSSYIAGNVSELKSSISSTRSSAVTLSGTGIGLAIAGIVIGAVAVALGRRH